MANIKIINGEITSMTEGIALNDKTNVATGLDSVAFGNGTTSSGPTSFACGSSNTASGDASFVTGLGNTASGIYSHAEGNGAVASHYNEYCRGHLSLALKKNQYGYANWIGRTTSNTLNVEIFLDESSSRFTIPVGAVYGFEIKAIAVIASTGEAKFFRGEGAIKNIGGTTSFVGGSVTTSVISQDAALAGVIMSIQANNTNDALQIACSGIAATNIDWHFAMEYVSII